jgi:predicted alpha/beta-hydrolase family hydrolase
VAKALANAGYAVLRYDLPFRQAGGGGVMNAAAQARDRAGIVKVGEELRGLYPKARLVLAGHSYGGRQSSILAAEDPSQSDALLLLSYPLHPPRQPEKARTDHFPQLRTPALFVHGSRDPFGTIEEMEAALKLISSKVVLKTIPKGAHNLPVGIADSIPKWLPEVL